MVKLFDSPKDIYYTCSKIYWFGTIAALPNKKLFYRYFAYLKQSRPWWRLMTEWYGIIFSLLKLPEMIRETFNFLIAVNLATVHDLSFMCTAKPSPKLNFFYIKTRVPIAADSWPNYINVQADWIDSSRCSVIGLIQARPHCSDPLSCWLYYRLQWKDLCSTVVLCLW